MNLEPAPTARELADLLGTVVLGTENTLVHGINEIHRVRAGDLTFVDVAKYFRKALESPAQTVLINESVPPPDGKALILSEDPFRDFNFLLDHFRPRISHTVSGSLPLSSEIRCGAHVVVGEDVAFGENIEIGPNTVIGSQVQIGNDVLIGPNVTINSHTRIGSGVIIQAGAVIGSDAFYYKRRPDRRDPMLSRGDTWLDDYVHVGANATIDKGVTDTTYIGKHTKLDNLVHIGHDTRVGAFCIMAAQVAIAGACTIEDDVVIWGQAGISSDNTIGQGAVIMAKTAVINSLPGGMSYFGPVGREAKRTYRALASMYKLPELLPRLEKLLAQNPGC